MGGVKNKDAKKKANNVYSGGSVGGGNKGPSTVDKRVQELPCPYCDRVFKQQSRFQQHLQSKHTDEVGEDPSDGRPSEKAEAAGSTSNSGSSKVMTAGSSAGAYTHKSPRLLLTEQCRSEGRVKPRFKAMEKDSGRWGCRVVLPHERKSELDVIVFLPDEMLADSEEDALERGALAALHSFAGHRALQRILPAPYIPMWDRLSERAEARAASQRSRDARQESDAKRATARKRRDVQELLDGTGAGMTVEKVALLEGLLRKALPATELQNAERPGSAAVVKELMDLGSTPAQARMAAAASGPTGSVEDALGWMCLHLDACELPAALRVQTGRGTFSVVHAAPPKKADSSGTLDCAAMPDEAVPEDSTSPGDRTVHGQAHGETGIVLQRFGYAVHDVAGALAATADGALLAAWSAMFQHLIKAPVAALDAPVAAGSADSETAWHSAEPPIGLSQGTVAAEVQLLLAALEASDGQACCGQDASGVDAGGLPWVGWEDLDGEDMDLWTEEQAGLAAIYGSEGSEGPVGPIRMVARTPHAVLATVEVPAEALAELRVGQSSGTLEEEHVELGVLGVYWEGCGYPDAVPLFGLSCRHLPPTALLSLTRRVARHLVDNCLGMNMLHELLEHTCHMLAASHDTTHPLDAFSLRQEANAAMQHPPWRSDGADATGQKPREKAADTKQCGEKASNRRLKGRRGRGPRGPPRLSSEALQRETSRLADLMEQNRVAGKTAAMCRTREALPAFAQRDEVIARVLSHKVVVIAGATGCGKSTQVPQYLLEHEVSQGVGGAANLICTQPRRLPAIALASRVAAETHTTVGDVVGYSVRLDTKASPQTHLLFCTTGVLLRRLTSDPELSGVTHVIVDEVHERSVESDLLLLLLRGTLRHRRGQGLRLVLMSATADANVFVKYFAEVVGEEGVGVVDIPGFTHPVRELFLEEVLLTSGTNIKGSVPKGAARNSRRDQEAMLSKLRARAAPGTPASVLKDIAAVDESVLNYALIEAAVAYVVSEEATYGSDALLADWSPPASRQDAPSKAPVALDGPGAILVFLPGAPEISNTERVLRESAKLRAAMAAAGTESVLVPLHGSLPSESQAAAFRRFGPGKRKIVLSTNVAETSVTIDDVTVVIDAGRVKEMMFDAAVGVARLVETWVSQASARQRRGRAGRVRPGVCLRLFSSATWHTMAAHSVPEILRSPLEPLCLQVKALAPERPVRDVLRTALSPPVAAAVDDAMGLLLQRQLLDEEEQLTPLGEHLTNLPLDPAVGKMLVYGAMMQCTDPVLTIAAALGHGRSPFLTPPDPEARNEADAARRTLLGESGLNAKSDHLAVVHAFNMYRLTLRERGRGAALAWCRRTFVSITAMEAIAGGRGQYAECLAERGFISADYARSSRTAGAVAAQDDPHDCNADDAKLFKAAICAGFYPQVLRADNPLPKFAQKLAGAVEVDTSDRVPKLFERRRGRVFVHPSSVNFSVPKFETGWVLYTDMVETSKVYVRQSSMVPVYAVLLFGGKLHVDFTQGKVVVDGWARIGAAPKVGVLVRELRKLLDGLFAAKLQQPEIDLGSEAAVAAMLEVIRTDGL